MTKKSPIDEIAAKKKFEEALDDELDRRDATFTPAGFINFLSNPPPKYTPLPTAGMLFAEITEEQRAERIKLISDIYEFIKHINYFREIMIEILGEEKVNDPDFLERIKREEYIMLSERGISIDGLIYDAISDENGIKEDSEETRAAILEIVKRYAELIKQGSAAATEQQATLDQLPSVSHQKLKDVMYPLDKVNSYLFGLVAVGEETPLKAESDTDNRKGKQANIYILLDFDEIDGLKISRKLTAYDKRVFIAVANLAKQGHWITTAEQIYKAMGNKGRPNAATIEKILESVEILSRARVYIDNTEETKLYTKYEKIKGSFYLLATEQVTAYAKGVIVKDAIKILGIPQLLTFAENRGQVTTTPLALLESPMSQTEANLLLEDYLFSRIARMKNAKRLSKAQKTILIETIYQKCNIATYKQKQRLPDKIMTILDHYKNEGWIKGYILTDRSVDIEL